jgi:hypothetical protein
VVLEGTLFRGVACQCCMYAVCVFRLPLPANLTLLYGYVRCHVAA